MRFLSVPLVLIILFWTTASGAWTARLDVDIDLSEQKMTVRLDARTLYYWPVSTARPGYRTPTGTFRPYRLERMWYSTIYDYAPMPYSIFFYGGYAIHGTTEISRLGRPASHGCVRLHPENARLLYRLIREVGKSDTRIVIRP
jgi:lipoprotein-anchoring transpeptidase ErfK/SrfK